MKLCPGNPETTRAREGIALYVVICTLLIVSVLAFSSHSFSIHSIRRARRLADSRSADLLIRSAVSCAVGVLQEGVGDPDSPLFQFFLRKELTAGAEIPLNLEPLTNSVEKIPDAESSARVFLEEVLPLDPDRLTTKTGGGDPVEKALRIRIEAHARCGAVVRNLVETRSMRMINLMPGIFGKFSLFIRNVEAKPDAYNQFANDLNGEPDDRVLPGERFIPMILKNGGELDLGASGNDDPESYQLRGYVYMGGNGVTLNLTAGDDEGFGENFHFFRLGNQSTTPGYYDPAPLPFFAQSSSFQPRHSQTLNPGSGFSPDFAYLLKNVVSGYYSVDLNENDMNVEKRLDLTFPGAKKEIDPRMRSSILHLYGTRSNPSPTLVLGNVSRQYVEYAGIVLEATGNQTRDAIVGYVQESKKSLDRIAPFPTEINAAARGDLDQDTIIKLDSTQVSHKNLFGSEGAYQSKMCGVRVEPYLRSHDFMYFRPQGKYDPEKSLFGGGRNVAAFQQSFSLNLHKSLKSEEPFFDNGDLAAIPPNFLAAKAVYRVRNLEEFKNRFTQDKGKKLVLNTAAIISGGTDGTLSLPPNLIIDKGGIIILEKGNLRISGIQNGSDPDQFVTFVALAGNIELDLSRSSRLTGFLAAPNGRIVNLTPSRPLDLEGGIAVGQYPPDTFKAGGRIAFADSTDPSGPDWKLFYRAFIADLGDNLKRF